jgi:HSP20 family protein
MYNDFHPGYCKQPATNIVENENDFRIELVAPGLKKEQISLNVKDDVLTIKAEVEPKDSKENNQGYVRKEFNPYNFEKHFNLPETVDSENISASFENGILYVSLPKKEKAPEKAPVTINIQ